MGETCRKLGNLGEKERYPLSLTEIIDNKPLLFKQAFGGKLPPETLRPHIADLLCPQNPGKREGCPIFYNFDETPEEYQAMKLKSKGKLSDHFGEIDDPRIERTKRHKLIDK